jgi:glycosyltransferase involved in cell wall biosynthesis
MDRKTENYRVGHLVNQLNYGVAAGDLTKALNEYTDIESTVISLQRPDEYPEDVSAVYPPSRVNSARISPERIRWLNETIREFDIITSHQTLAGLLGAIVSKYQGKPLVAREGNNHKKFSFKIRSTRAMTNLIADRIVCVSKSVADSYKGFESIIPKSKMTVITNGVDIEAVQSAEACEWSIYSSAQIDREASVVGTVGMLIEQKNHETLLKALNQLVHEQGENVELVLAGTGPRLEHLQNLAKRHDIEDKTHFLGYLSRDRVYKLLHEIDCYAMPSRWEGFSASVLQAMAAGVPCVLSEIPSFMTQYPESVAMFHEANSETDLAESIYTILQDENGVGSRGCNFVTENYTIERMATRYASLYRECLNEI